MPDFKPKNVSEQSSETQETLSDRKNNDAPSYYYDDAHGYEIFYEDDADEESAENETSKNIKSKNH